MRCNHCFGITRLWDAKVLAHSLAEYADRALARSADATDAIDAAMEADASIAADAAMEAWARHEAAEADWEATEARVRSARGAVQRAGGCLSAHGANTRATGCF